MTFTANPSTLFSDPTAFTSANAVAQTTAQFKRLSVDDQLAALWFIYKQLGRSITPAAPGAARLQLAEGLLEQIKQMPPASQLQVMRDLVLGTNTPLTRAYGVFSANTKLGFWYQLAELMKEGTVIPVPDNYKLSADAAQVICAIEELEFNQQITMLRNAVVDMGVDPLA